MKIIVAVQGGVGSFSEAVGEVFIRKHAWSAKLSYLISAERVLKALDQGEADFGVIAIANNRGGVVWESVEALARYPVEIVDKHILLVEQNLLAKEGVTLSEITEVHSHVQAISQSRDFLFQHLWGVKLVVADDTAESARRLSMGEIAPTAAVIARIECAKRYGLNILEANVQDLSHNETQFLLLKKLV